MTLKITALSTVASFKISIYSTYCMCQTAMRDWESAAALLIALARLKFLGFLLLCFRPAFRISLTFKRRNLFSRKALLHHLILNSHHGVLQTLHRQAPNWIPVFGLFWRYLNGSYSSGPSAIQPAVMCKASTTWSLRSLSSTSSSTLVSSSSSIFSVTRCRCDSLPFFSLQDLLLIEHFYTWHDFRVEGSWQQVLENEPRDPLRLCFLLSRIALPFCSLSCFFHLSTLISVRSGSFRLDLCLIVLWNTIYPRRIRVWEPGLQTPHRPPPRSLC